MVLFNKGDTALILLNYNVNGSAMVEDAYDEIEFQINPQCNTNSIKKLLSDGSIEWGTATYDDDGTTETFTGYMCTLSQEETFLIRDGLSDCQLRVMINGNVGSSEITQIDLGKALSLKVLE